MFFSMVLLGSVAFYVDSAMGVFELWIGVHGIFSGYLIPLEVLRRLAAGSASSRRCCRSGSCSRFPVETLVGLLSPAPGAAPAGGAVAVRGVTGVLALRAWRAGVRRFAAFGG